MTRPVAKAILKSANWLATTPQDQRPQPIIPYLKKTFGLTSKEAAEAIREANLRVRSH